jgi:hypothetical protein
MKISVARLSRCPDQNSVTETLERQLVDPPGEYRTRWAFSWARTSNKSKRKSGMKYVQVEIVPIFDDGPVYYKTIVYDLVVRDKAIEERTVRDIFHCDELIHSVDVLKSAILS